MMFPRAGQEKIPRAKSFAIKVSQEMIIARVAGKSKFEDLARAREDPESHVHFNLKDVYLGRRR